MMCQGHRILYLVIACLTFLHSHVVRAETLQGFCASTPGGTGQPVYRVTNLADDGPGSLRDAVSRGNRHVVFGMSGAINLSKDIYVRGAFLTIDAATAPAPGVTVKNHGLLVHGDKGAHDVIIRGLRLRSSHGCDTCGSSGAGIGIGRRAYNIVLDHVSVQGAEDQALSIGKGAHDITVQWSIFAEGAGKNLPVLLTGVQRVSLHHNLVIKGHERLPQIKWSDRGEQAPDTQADMRNNLFWDWSSAGSQIWKGTKANVVANYYYSPKASETSQQRAIFMCHAGSKPPQCDGTRPQWYARAYIADNLSGHGPATSDYLNRLGTESTSFPAPP
jgi:pectate lyase